MNNERLKELKTAAAKIRIYGLDAVYHCSSGHIGGSFSIIDILTVLYFDVMKIDVNDCRNPERDRLVMSKGHCTPALYPTLALRGFFPKEDLKQFRDINGHMSGHAEMNYVSGVDMSTGSLGQGLSAAVGMALAGKLDRRNCRIYAVMGDGEIAEGQIWEAAMAAAKYKLDNLCGIVDVNGLQIDGTTEEVMPTEPMDKKWEAFGWNVIKIDGHNLEEISEAFAKAAACKNKPTVILAKTIKGKGVSFMENNVSWHGKVPDKKQYLMAKDELEALLKEQEA